MSYASLTNFPASSKLSLHSANGGTAVAGWKGQIGCSVGIGSMYEFLLIADAAYSRATVIAQAGSVLLLTVLCARAI